LIIIVGPENEGGGDKFEGRTIICANEIVEKMDC
jgi:hypothetical protein